MWSSHPLVPTRTYFYIVRGANIVIPDDLGIDVRGNAFRLEYTLAPFANMVLSMVPVLTISVNAAIEDADIEPGFDNTTGLTERDYFQNYIPPEPNIVGYICSKRNL